MPTALATLLEPSLVSYGWSRGGGRLEREKRDKGGLSCRGPSELSSGYHVALLALGSWSCLSVGEIFYTCAQGPGLVLHHPGPLPGLSVLATLPQGPGRCSPGRETRGRRAGRVLPVQGSDSCRLTLTLGRPRLASQELDSGPLPFQPRLPTSTTTCGSEPSHCPRAFPLHPPSTCCDTPAGRFYLREGV